MLLHSCLDIRPNTCGTGRCKTKGRKSKEAKGVLCMAEPKPGPIKHPQTGKNKWFSVQHVRFADNYAFDVH